MTLTARIDAPPARARSFTCACCLASIPLPDGPGAAGCALVSSARPNVKICYACADKRARLELLDRSKPFVGYLSADESSVTTWTGGLLMNVIRSNASRNGWHGSEIVSVLCIDVHGNRWHGRGAGAGMAIRLRPAKAPKPLSRA